MVALRATPGLRVILYGTGFVQATETEDAASASALRVSIAVGETDAMQEAWTVAETPIEALAVAAFAGLIPRPDARMAKTKTGNVVRIGTAIFPYLED
jgi:hypothetical protein